MAPVCMDPSDRCSMPSTEKQMPSTLLASQCFLAEYQQQKARLSRPPSTSGMVTTMSIGSCACSIHIRERLQYSCGDDKDLVTTISLQIKPSQAYHDDVWDAQLLHFKAARSQAQGQHSLHDRKCCCRDRKSPQDHEVRCQNRVHEVFWEKFEERKEPD